MTDKKDIQKPQAQQVKTQINHVKTSINPIEQQKVKAQVSKVKQQVPLKNTKKIDTSNKKIESKRLALVLYQIAKTKQSVFTQEQKYPLMASLGGLFLTLCSATLVNIGQSIIKPELKKKKIFIFFGAANLFASLFLGGYSIYKLSDMYVKIPEQQWDIISKEKQAYDKLSFSEKKAYLQKDLQEEQKKLKQALIQSQLLKKQQRIDLTK